jgi:hypothetical protein
MPPRSKYPPLRAWFALAPMWVLVLCLGACYVYLIADAIKRPHGNVLQFVLSSVIVALLTPLGIAFLGLVHSATKATLKSVGLLLVLGCAIAGLVQLLNLLGEAHPSSSPEAYFAGVCLFLLTLAGGLSFLASRGKSSAFMIMCVVCGSVGLGSAVGTQAPEWIGGFIAAAVMVAMGAPAYMAWANSEPEKALSTP